MSPSGVATAGTTTTGPTGTVTALGPAMPPTRTTTKRRRGDCRKKWTSLETLRLISEFQSMPFLWNVFDDEYKNKRLKARAIERLACYFATSPKEIHRKLHNLRCQYRSEIRKISSRGTGPAAAEPRQSQWSYFESLKFLSPVVNVRSVVGADVISGMGCYEPGQLENTGGPYPGDGYTDEDPDDGSASRDMKFSALELELLRKRADSPSDLNDKRNLEVIKLDDFDIFGKLVATHLRKMPLERAIRCQEKLFTLIMQERLAESECPPGQEDLQEGFSPGFRPPSP